MFWKLFVAALIILLFFITLAILYGANRWRWETKKLLAKMEAARVPIIPRVYNPRELEGVPAPVQRYFRTVLKEGQPLIAAVNVQHAGEFNMSEAGEQWKQFQSTQRVITHPPGFIWDARIRLAPAISIHAHDAYVAGEGVLTAKLIGLWPVMKQPSTPELAQGELMRFFAEGAWYPTALLPSQGVVWEAIDDTQARARLTDGSTTVELVFQFDDQGVISSVRSPGRYREVNGVQVTTPWQGRFWGYELRAGMLIPLAGEVSWLIKQVPRPYWRGRVQRIEYEYTQ